MQIDKESFIPAYVQLAELLEKKINTGELLPGDRIPSKAELGQMLNLSSVTVQRAFEILAKKGLVISERGKGTFVARLSLNDVMFKVSEFYCDMQEQGLDARIKILENRITQAPQFLKEKGLSGDRVLELSSLAFAGGEPVMFRRQYVVTHWMEAPSAEDAEQNSFAELAEKAATEIPIRSLLTINAVMITGEEAALLRAQEDLPGFLIEQTLFTAMETAVAYGAYFCRGDKYRFSSTFNY